MKLQKKFKMLFNIFAVIIGVYALFMVPVIGVPVIGGVILQGILGGFSGKVGPVVGGSWKGIDYMRGYVIPANPNTAGQQTQRTKFGVMVSYAQALLPTIIQTFWNPFAVKMSGFNHFISLNINELDASNLFTITNPATKGTLESTSITTAEYDSGGGQIVVSYNALVTGNGEDDDDAYLLAWDKSANTFYYTGIIGDRQDASLALNVPTGLTATNLLVWIFFARGTGEDFVVSDSVAQYCVAV